MPELDAVGLSIPNVEIAHSNNKFVFSIVNKSRPHNPFEIDLRIGLKQYTPRFLGLLKQCIEYEAGRNLQWGTFDRYITGIVGILNVKLKNSHIDQWSNEDLLLIAQELPRSVIVKNVAIVFQNAFDRPNLGRDLFDPDFKRNTIECLRRKQDSTRSIITGIVTKALSTEVYANVWANIETAVGDGKILNSAFCYFAVQAVTNARGMNLYPCKVSDLVQLESEGPDGEVTLDWYLRIYLAKSRLDKRTDIGSLQPLPKEVGDRLNVHRKEVIKLLGPFFTDHLDQIALFPSFHWAYVMSGIKAPREWSVYNTSFLTENRKQAWLNNFGRFESPLHTRHSYLRQIKNLVGSDKIGSIVVRHTIGTHLAHLGYDARTIARVLQQSDNTSAQFYVDITFTGLLDKFGKKFEEQTAPILGNLLARVDGLVVKDGSGFGSDQLVQAMAGNKVVTTGACKTKRCRGVPYQCYLCPSKSFIPFAEGDHQAVLDDLITYRDEELPHLASSFKLETDNINSLALRIEAVIRACEQFLRAEHKGAMNG